MKTTTRPTAVCDLPPPTREEYRARLEHVRRNGQQHDICVNERGRVIDGLTLLKIANSLGIRPRTRVYRGLAEADKRALRRSLNLARRTLTTDQRQSIIGGQLSDTPRWSDARIGQALGVPAREVGRLRAGLEARGTLSRSPFREGRDGRVRRTSGRGFAPAEGFTGRATRAGLNGLVRLVHGSCPEALSRLPSHTLDLVLSDPAYPEIDRAYGRYTERAWLDMMRATVSECRRLLKPTGSMVWIVQPNSARAGRLRTWHLEFALWAAREVGLVQDAYWFNPAPMPGGGVQKGLMRSAVKWCVWVGPPDAYRDQSRVLKPYYEPGRERGDDRRAGPSGRPRRSDTMYRTAAVRGGATPFNVIEVAASSGSPGGEDHPAKTPLKVADWWCRYLLPEGGVLLDCFAGSGTMLEAGLRNRASQVIGVDRERTYLDICRRRLGV